MTRRQLVREVVALLILGFVLFLGLFVGFLQ
jgi:hypothetical protein